LDKAALCKSVLLAHPQQGWELAINSNPGYLKRTSTGGIQFILTSIIEERGCGEGTQMCRFSFCELIWYVYLYMMCLCCENVKISIFTFSPRRGPPPPGGGGLLEIILLLYNI
jgi:hypothetical protein